MINRLSPSFPARVVKIHRAAAQTYMLHIFSRINKKRYVTQKG